MKYKIAVVDDSALMRKIITDMVNSEPKLEVAFTARSGERFLEIIKNEKPDAVTLDVEMPGMSGIETLHILKEQNINIPVVILSSIDGTSTNLTMECLEKGAFDFVAKPSGTISLDLDKIRDELITKLKAACINDGVKQEDKPLVMAPRELKSDSKIKAVVIGASTGGPKALYSVLTSIKEKPGVPFFIVQHMPVGFTKAFAQRLNDHCCFEVAEAEQGEIIKSDRAYVAPAGYHMMVTEKGSISLSQDPPIWGVRPAVDKLFISAADYYKNNLISVVLTGMGKDGAAGTKAVKAFGGITFAEHASTCTIYGMPKAAVDTGCVDYSLPLTDIPEAIVKYLK